MKPTDKPLCAFYNQFPDQPCWGRVAFISTEDIHDWNETSWFEGYCCQGHILYPKDELYTQPTINEELAEHNKDYPEDQIEVTITDIEPHLITVCWRGLTSTMNRSDIPDFSKYPNKNIGTLKWIALNGK